LSSLCLSRLRLDVWIAEPERLRRQLSGMPRLEGQAISVPLPIRVGDGQSAGTALPPGVR